MIEWLHCTYSVFVISPGNGMPLEEKIELLLFLVRTVLYYSRSFTDASFIPQAGQYMVNYESTHCVILPTDYFKVPSPGNLD